jgi:hypothetical protein
MVALPSAIRTRLDATVELILGRIRGALDLPSRTELADLTQRLEELDRRIGALAAERVEAMVQATPALPEAAEAESAEVDAAPAAAAVEPAAAPAAAEPEVIPAPATSRRNARRQNAAHRARRK